MQSLKAMPCYRPWLVLTMKLPCKDGRVNHVFTKNIATFRAMHRKWEEIAIRGPKARAWIPFGKSWNVEILRGGCTVNAKAQTPGRLESHRMLSSLSTLQILWCTAVWRKLSCWGQGPSMFLSEAEIFERVSLCEGCRPKHKNLTEAAARGECLVLALVMIWSSSIYT